MQSFWNKLKKRTSGERVEPIMVLAPMADVTDAAFRRIIAKYSKWGGADIFDEKGNIRDKYIKDGKFTPTGIYNQGGPDVFWTEFVSADGLMLGGREHLMRDLIYSEAERPIVAQLFSSRPDLMYEASKFVVELGFDGLDINMGCPDRSIEKQKAGAAMIKNPRLAREVLRAAIDGAQSGKRKIPVSVKTRIGYNKNELETWLPELLAEKPAVITIHARTRKEMSKVPARWETIKQGVDIRNALGSDTLIFGNGDVLDIEDAKKKCEETGADGAMLGRAIFGNPFLFAGLHDSRFNLENSKRLNLGKEKLETYLGVMVEHAKLFEEILGGSKSFAIMKKHFKAYVTCATESMQHNYYKISPKDLRLNLMEAENAKHVEHIVSEYLNSIND